MVYQGAAARTMYFPYQHSPSLPCPVDLAPTPRIQLPSLVLIWTPLICMPSIIPACVHVCVCPWVWLL